MTMAMPSFTKVPKTLEVKTLAIIDNYRYLVDLEYKVKSFGERFVRGALSTNNFTSCILSNG